MQKLQFGKNNNYLKLAIAAFLITLAFTQYSGAPAVFGAAVQVASPRTRLLINDDWRFTKGDPPKNTTSLLYDVRPVPAGRNAAPAESPSTSAEVVKAWILPAGNNFLKDPSKGAVRPEGNLGDGVAYVAPGFDDSTWKKLDLPHDFAIEGPFSKAGSGSMGRLPSSGVVWYRKRLNLPANSEGKSIFLDLDGAMSYSEVWVNGQFVGGWPYGYSSFRLNVTPYVKPGKENVLAIRLDNPVPTSGDWQSGWSRWYPGGGIYRNVWLVKTSPVHVGQWGTHLTTPEISKTSASIVLNVSVDNDSKQDASVSVSTQIYEIDRQDRKVGAAVAAIAPVKMQIAAGKNAAIETKGTIANPKLWGTGLRQKPNRYVAVTNVRQNGRTVDIYETPFGVRTLKFDPNAGFFLNGEHIKLNGVCDHHDLGALGAAVNYRALQRQLEMLAEMGANAIRTSHNPPAPELLDLADKMGFLIMDEAFDMWARSKTALDYHLLYPDWYEQDLRALLRRDRNHPSVIMWSIGNEVGEQTTGEKGAAIAAELTRICHEEDPTRPTVSGMNSATTKGPFIAAVDSIGLNYQGVGIYGRPPQYPEFHQSFPDKFIVGSETASTISSRGVYTFPVASGLGAVATAKAGQDTENRQISSYDLYFTNWSYAPDKEFAAQDRYPFLGGEFVWTGWDYLGEPTPFDTSRSSYFGIIDLAGFKKDRFYLYQAYWRPEHPMAHILPHWTWPDRAGQVTPVHVYTSGDEAELFLNGKSLGRKKKAQFEYRLRWDDVIYEPGELKVLAYKGGKQWATETVKTADTATKLLLTPDKSTIANDGRDLSFITLTVADKNAQMAPRSMNQIHFEVSGPGEIIATDNGDPTDMTSFPSKDRKAFNGLALAIVRAKRGQSGNIIVVAKADGLETARITIVAK
jgi:beta-galactosidase